MNQPVNIFDAFLNNTMNYNHPQPFLQNNLPNNLLNLFNQFMPNQFNMNTFYDINDIFLNDGNLSNSQINNLNNIIPNLGNIYSTIHTNLMTGDYLGPFEVSITIPQQSSQINPPVVINQEELNNLEIIKHSDITCKEKYDECSICLSEFNDDSLVRLLKCEHGFHPECVDVWLKEYKYNCPVCRDGTI
jgi:hypothetical protein